jgi:hypothetical protein
MRFWVLILCAFLHEFSLPLDVTLMVERRPLPESGSGDVAFSRYS